MGLSEFRRSTKTDTKKSGGKGGRGNWRERFKMPKGQPTPFIIVKGEFIDPDPDAALVDIDPATGQPKPVITPYYKWLNHKSKVASAPYPKDEPCSRGWDKHNPQPCAGCMAMDMGDKRVSLSEQFSLTLVHLAVYHRHPAIDPKKGTVVMKKDNTPFLIETECLGKNCNFCRTAQNLPPLLQPGETWPQYDPQFLSVIFGARRYLQVGKGHLADIGEWDKQITTRCGGTAFARDPQGQYVKDQNGNAVPTGRCNNSLSIESYNCSNCNTVLIDVANDARTVEQLEELAMQKFPCHKCQRQVFLKEVNSCDAGCSGVVVQGAFDGVLWGMRQGEDTQSHLVLSDFQSIEAFEQKLHPNIRALFKGALREHISGLAKSYDFAELHKVRPIADQAARLEINLPQGFQAPSQPVAGSGYQQGGYAAQPPQYGVPYGAPQGNAYPQQSGGYQQAPQQPVGQPPAPQYQAYPQPTGVPQPPPFVPPAKPNFGS